MRLNAREVEDWGRALKFPLIVGAIGYLAWRIFRKKEDLSYNNINIAGMPTVAPGVSGSVAGNSPWGFAPYTDDQIKGDAQALLEAFDLDWAGTDEEEVETIRQKYVGRPRDLARLWNAFGMPGYGTTGRPAWGKGSPKTLKQWIIEELSGVDLKLWIDMFKLIGK